MSYYLGLDIGTNSVGWAVTDENYEILKYKKKALWGIRLFEEANPAAERRTKRANRRRLQRRKQRIDLLQELFAEEMAKVDPTFFIRLNESRLHLEDKTTEFRYPLFNDEDYTDIQYHKEYPTTFHLRKELIENVSEHDIRLVYLALHHILKNRGHFLVPGEIGDAKNFKATFTSFKDYLNDESLSLGFSISNENEEKLSEILEEKKKAKSVKAKEIAELFTVDEEQNLDKDEKKIVRSRITEIAKLMAGNKGDITKIFDINQDGIEKKSFSFADMNYEEEVKTSLESSIPDEFAVIESIKAIYDWSILVRVLSNQEYISFAKVEEYNKHKEDSKKLHDIIKKYCDRDTIKEFFDGTEANTYSSYVGKSKTNGKTTNVKKQSISEDFYKKIKVILSTIEDCISEEDREVYDYLVSETECETLLPLQRSKNNGVIPNQINKAELKKILENAESYLPFLAEKDEEGLSISQKIVKIFEFRVPYYVGPLSDRHKDQGANVWIVRKEEGKIYPWNFEKKVDEEASNQRFIERMTNKCTYIYGEDVLPKQSLLYSKYMVLNEINNIKVFGRDITVELKQDIYEALFKTHTKVTRKMLHTYLLKYMPDLEIEDISGFDGDFKASLSSYLDFKKKVFGDKIDEYEYGNIAEDIIRWSTIYSGDSRMLRKTIEHTYPGKLTESEMKAACSLKYSGWGNFSRKFLTEIESVVDETGEIVNIITALWSTNLNLMQLLSNNYEFRKNIDDINNLKRGIVKEISYETLVRDLYVSPANKRAIWQTLKIVEELTKVLKEEPARIFVEMARGGEKEKKRKESRKAQLLELYKNSKDDTRDWIKEISERDERQFNSIKLFLYYTQMGRCMYSGEAIDLDELMSANSRWDRDHIFPQSKVKDDSLDNLVLVNKTLNTKKTNEMIPAEWQKKMQPTWKFLLDKGYISQKKYDRLTHDGPLSDEELAGFINRQLVETRQSTKAIAELLGQIYSKSKIVYVKAALASGFREDNIHVLKSRLLNDYHHAKDAYLNIVVGNVYNAKFTDNPVKWMRENRDTNYSLNRVFDWEVKRGNEVVWEPEMVNRVRDIVKQNNILYTEHTYCGKGQLFDETIYSKDSAATIKIKDNLDIDKYGGYKSAKISYFASIEFDGKNGERVKNIIGVPIYISNQLEYNPNAFIEYCENAKGLKNVKILKAKIQKNALLVVDGYPMRIRGEKEKGIIFKNNVQLILDEKDAETLRIIEKLADKETRVISEKYDGITNEMLDKLYDVYLLKLEGIYINRPSNQKLALSNQREKFLRLSLVEKTQLLKEETTFFNTSASTMANLSLIDLGTNVGGMVINKNTIGKSKVVLVNQSVTGIFENRERL